MPRNRIGEAFVEIDADTRGLEAGLARSERSLGRFSRSLGPLTGPAGVAAVGAAFSAAAVGIARFSAEASKLTVFAERVDRRFVRTFGNATESTERWAQAWVEAGNATELQARQILGTTGNLLRGFGATNEQAAELSIGVAELAGRLAAFNPEVQSGADAADRLRRALLGEAESAKELGVVITQAEVQRRALILADKDHVDQLTILDKAYATLAIAQEQSLDTIGATVDDVSRAQVEFQGLREEILLTAGRGLNEGLLPALNDLSDWVDENKEALLEAFREFGRVGADAIGKIVEVASSEEAQTALRLLERVAQAIQFLGRGGFAQYLPRGDEAGRAAADARRVVEGVLGGSPGRGVGSSGGGGGGGGGGTGTGGFRLAPAAFGLDQQAIDDFWERFDRRGRERRGRPSVIELIQPEFGLDQGLIDEELTNQFVERQRRIREINRLTAENASEEWDRATDAMASAVGNFAARAVTDFDSIGDAARNLLGLVANIAAQVFIAEPLADALRGLRGRQFGGFLSPGLSVVGEGGKPELIDTARPARVYSNRELRQAFAGGGDGGVTLNIDVAAGVDQTMVGAAVRQAVSESVSEVRDLLNRPGSLRRAARR